MAKPNIKELVVNHFEKGIFAVACLVALAMLAGTRWAPYGHYPNEISRKVSEADAKIAGRNWPEEEKVQFEVAEEDTIENLVARNVGHQIDPTPYEFDVSFSPGLYDVTKPITEPEYVTIAALIAEPGRFLMAVQPEPTSPRGLTEEDPAAMASDTTEEDDQSDIPEEFRTRPTGGAAGAGAGGLGVSGLGMGGRDRFEEEFSDGYDLEMNDPAAMMGMGYGGEYGDEMGGMGMGMGMASNMEGRGLRFVAVRGIIPLREQIRKFMKAIHVRFPQASSLYEIIEFELERKKMQPGDDPWGGGWEQVEIDIAIDTLNEALSFDQEVVQGSITDSAVTMPLPGRLMGVWKSKATHPQLENFTLSPEEMEQELEFNRMLLQQYEEQQESAPEIVQKGGFSGIAYDSRSMQMDVMGMGYGEGTMEEYDYESGMAGPAYGSEMGGAGEMGMMAGINYAPTSQGRMTKEAEEALKKLKAGIKNDDEREQALYDYVKERITAQGELLLFRYFDFDVEPGASYKYRARLIVRNPNFGRPIAQVAGLSTVVEGQTRKSDWSNETKPARVPLDVDYFVANIDEKGSGFAKATMSVFQWNPDYGTTIHSSLEVGYGEEIGGPKKTFVLDPAKNSFEIEQYTFHTGDVLVDALPEDKIRTNEHPDLELPRSARGSLGISGQVLISQGNGQLAVIDHHSRVSAYDSRRKYLEYEQKPYEDIKNREAQKPDMNDMEQFSGAAEYGMMMGEEMGGGDMGGMYGDYYGGEGGGEEDYGRGKRRRGSALRKQPGRGGRGR